MAQSEPAEQRRPLLKLVRGDATPEEIAAIVAVLAAHAAASTEPAPRAAPSVWADRGYAMRVGTASGPGGWRRASRVTSMRTT